MADEQDNEMVWDRKAEIERRKMAAERLAAAEENAVSDDGGIAEG